MTKPQITRRTMLGGISAMFAVASAPAPAMLAIAPVHGKLLDFEILKEEWLDDPSCFGWCYRCMARNGDKYAYAGALIGGSLIGGKMEGPTLELRAIAREDARRMLLRYFRKGGGIRASA